MKLARRLRAAYVTAAQEEGAQPPVTRILLGIIHGASAMGRSALQDQLPVRAGMLAFWSLMAVVPVLVLAYSVLGPLGLLDDASLRLQEIILETMLTESVAEVGPWLDDLVRGVELEALGWVGFLVMLGVGLNLYVNVEKAYNDIFKVRLQRPWLLRVVLFYAVVTLGPLLFVAGFWASSALPANLVGTVTPVLLVGSVFVLAIKLLPQTGVTWPTALVSGLFTAILFELLREGFGAYTTLLGTASTAVRLYGALWLLPVFLLYLYATWMVVLLGVELAQVIHNARPLMAEARDQLVNNGGRGLRRADSLFALQAAISFTSRFVEDGGSVSTYKVAEDMGSPGRNVVEAMDMLETAGVVVRCSDSSYAPARPVETFTGRQLLEALARVSAPPLSGSPPGRERLQQAVEALGDHLDLPLIELARPGGNAL